MARLNCKRKSLLMTSKKYFCNLTTMNPKAKVAITTSFNKRTNACSSSLNEDCGEPSKSKRGKRTSSDSRETGQSHSTEPSLVTAAHKAVESLKLGRAFFDVPCATLARNLLGQHIVKSVGTQRIKGRIVETEAYQGPEDKAAHSYQGKQTPKNEAMFMTPGTCYVYNIYGMYCCMNISSRGDGAAVLIRGLEPLAGQDLMEKGRKTKKDADNKKPLKEKDLTNGPSKLCQALYISKNECNKVDLTSSDSLWLEEGDDVDDGRVVSCPRINIGYAEDWKEKPLRFYILGNSCVSVKDKKAELEMNTDILATESGKKKS